MSAPASTPARAPTRAPMARFDARLLWAMRVAGIGVLASVIVASVGHRPEAFRTTAGWFALMFLLLALAFARGGILSWRRRGAAWALLLLACATAGWLALAGAAAVAAIRPWGPAEWRPIGALVAAALVFLALAFGPVLLRGRSAR